MSKDLVYQLVELVLTLAQNELDGSDTEQVLIDIIDKGLETYHDSAGMPLDLNRVPSLKAL
jgi:hypothetical protein